MTSTWLIGHGLLGGAVARVSPHHRVWRWRGSIPWGRRDAVEAAIRSAAAEFFAQLGEQPWEVAWCAGAGIFGSTTETFQDEIAALGALLDALDAGAPRAGRMFFASSIGAIHGGASSPPFDETSPVAPTSSYGQARAEQEDLVRAWVQGGHRAVLGRITNLYGPGQQLAKSQGLVTQVCRSHLLRQPIRLYVSLETTRDYLYADDAGEMVLSLLDGLALEPDASATVRILASGFATTLGQLLQTCERVLRTPLRIITVQSELTSVQARDLRVRPLRPVSLRATPTPLAVGVRRTFDDLMRRYQLGLLASPVGALAATSPMPRSA